jgi:predicted nucleotidyltransferase
MKAASYTLPDNQKKYLLKKAHEMGLTQVQVLRVIMADYMERNPLR